MTLADDMAALREAVSNRIPRGFPDDVSVVLLIDADGWWRAVTYVNSGCVTHADSGNMPTADAAIAALRKRAEER